jgi:hypothetical protein
LEPGLALKAHHLSDRVVLDRPQARRVEVSGGVTGPGVEELPRTQQAADVIRPERRFGPLRHCESQAT